jgi:hypothetical protein
VRRYGIFRIIENDRWFALERLVPQYSVVGDVWRYWELLNPSRSCGIPEVVKAIKHSAICGESGSEGVAVILLRRDGLDEFEESCGLVVCSGFVVINDLETSVADFGGR